MKLLQSAAVGFRRHSTLASDICLAASLGTAGAAALVSLHRSSFLIPEFALGMSMVSGLYFLLALGYWIENLVSARNAPPNPAAPISGTTSLYGKDGMRRTEIIQEDRTTPAH